MSHQGALISGNEYCKKFGISPEKLASMCDEGAIEALDQTTYNKIIPCSKCKKKWKYPGQLYFRYTIVRDANGIRNNIAFEPDILSIFNFYIYHGLTLAKKIDTNIIKEFRKDGLSLMYFDLDSCRSSSMYNSGALCFGSVLAGG